jgi:hypothetical protein
MVSFDHIDCLFGLCDRNCWAIQLHLAMAKVQDTDKFVDQRLGCLSRGVSVIHATRTVTVVRSLFLAWVCFSIAFSTVFQPFLKNYLFDSGYKTPIQNMDELYASGIKLAYHEGHGFVFDNGDETEASKVQSNRVKCPSFEVYQDWAKYQ